MLSRHRIAFLALALALASRLDGQDHPAPAGPHETEAVESNGASLGLLHESYREPISPKSALETVFVVKEDVDAGRGRCLPEMTGDDYREELKRLHVERIWGQAGNAKREVPQGDPGRLGPEPARTGIAMARVFQMIERLSRSGFLGRDAPMSTVTKFYDSPDATSRQLGPTSIELGCGNQARTGLGFAGQPAVCGTSNHALIAHEFAHKVGNHQGPFGDLYGFYGQRMRDDGVACYPSGYARRKYNEQVADVFAAYVTNPDLLVPETSAFDAAKARLMAGEWPAEATPASQQSMGCARAYIVLEMFFRGLSSFSEIDPVRFASCRDRREMLAEPVSR